MKQTAVEWLVEQLRQLAHNPNTHIGMGDIRVTQGHLDQLEEQAKEMEKEYLYNFYMQGKVDIITVEERNVEQYYNETFKSE